MSSATSLFCFVRLKIFVFVLRKYILDLKILCSENYFWLFFVIFLSLNETFTSDSQKSS